MNCKIVADDYGMSLEVNHAISELVCKNIVSKISIMANESIQYQSSDIEQAETGLHINLIAYMEGTRTRQDNRVSPLKLLYLLYTKRLNDVQIKDSILHQLNFLEERGIKISYLDTHQHVHIIPRLLNLLIIFAKAKGIDSIRCITMSRKHVCFYLYSLMRFGFLTQVPKMILLYSFGFLMKMKLDKCKINYCKNLVLMPLAGSGDYEGLLKTLFKRFREEDAEFVTHPGLQMGTYLADKYSSGRYIEYCSLLNLTLDSKN